jgi:hypothetical protein
VWVNGLPPDAAIWRVDGQEWTVLHELLAINAERVDAWGLATVRMQASKKTQKFLPDKSLQIPRPGETTEQDADRVITDPKEIAAWFGA